MDDKLTSELDFKLERLRFVLQQIDRLNERFYKYIALFQTLSTAIVGGGVAVFIGWGGAGITAEAAKAIIYGLLGLFVLLGSFLVILVVTGIISWFDYRLEEVRILDDVVGKGYRKAPTLSNVFRWHEFYVILLVIFVVILVCFFVTYRIIPLIA